ncbi:MAG: TolC family protein [Bacteroidales bacterium]|jgi:outer membrane protein TolC
MTLEKSSANPTRLQMIQIQFQERNPYFTGTNHHQAGGRNHLIQKFLLIAILCISGLFSNDTTAQEGWSLNMCIEYALDNNLDLNQKTNLVKNQEVNLLESKASLLPGLNMGSDLSANFGRNIDGNTNAITFERTIGNQYWISSSLDIFRGMIKQNTIRYNHYLLSASKEEVSVTKNQLIFNILTSYYTVIFSVGLTEVAQGQVALSELQYNRMQKFVDVGRESPITVQELKSQWAGDKLNLTRAQGNMSTSLLDLKQLLRIEAGQPFNIDSITPNLLSATAVPDIDSLFKSAVNLLPEIKQQEYLLSASEKELAVAKGGIYPSVYLSAGYNSNFFDGDTLRYITQLENNQNQWVNLGIRIPIFNQASVYSLKKRKQIAIENQEYELQKRKDALYSEIWKAIDELQSSRNEYQASVESREFSRLSLENVAKKMEKGLASATDFEASKQRFVSAEAALLKAKLIYIMRKQMLEFYKTGSWNHLY